MNYSPNVVRVFERERESKNHPLNFLLKTLFSLIIFVSFFFLAHTSVYAATYYVANAGNDSCNGQSQTLGSSGACSWKTIAKVNSSAFSPGDSIQFNKGDTWREQLTIPSSGSSGNPITFSSYGSGANPIITGSDLITVGWSKQTTNVWKASVATQPNIVYINGTRGVQVSSSAAVTTEFNWYWASGVLYVWSPPDTDPSAYYTNPGIEAGARNRVVFTNEHTYLTFSGLTLRDGNSVATYNANFLAGWTTVDGLIIDSCIIERGDEMGINIQPSTVAGSFILRNSTIRNNGADAILVSGGSIPPPSSLLISNNTWYGNTWRSATDNIYYSTIVGNFGTGEIAGNVISDSPPGTMCKSGAASSHCQAIYTLANASTTNASVVHIHNNTIYNQMAGAGVKLMTSGDVYDNLIYDNVGRGVFVTSDGNSNDITAHIYRNLIYRNNPNAGPFGGVAEEKKGTGSLTLIVEQNTLYLNSSTNMAEIYLMDTITSLTVRNNILFTTPTRAAFYSSNPQPGALIDYNLQWRADGNPNNAYNGVFNLNWAAWQALGFDAHGINADPKFTNPDAGDFTLQAGSPALNTGTFITGVSLSNPTNMGIPVPMAPPTVSSFKIDGPASGSIGVASLNFTVTPNSVYTGTVTVTPNGGGLSTPIVLTFSNSMVGQTFTITPSLLGIVNLVATNGGGLTNPATSSYTVTVPPSYYVSQSGGNDSNPGTLSQPWKTIAKVNASTFSPATTIYFNKGDTWREELYPPSSGLAGNPITFSSYGSGANPIITGSDLITAGWSKQATNVWKAAVTTQPNVVYVNGTRGTPVASIATVTSEFNWYWASNVLYVWSPPDTDPSLYYTVPGIESGARDAAAHTNNHTYLTFSGLTFRDGNSITFATVKVGTQTADGITFDTCVIERGVSRGIDLDASVTAGSFALTNSTISNNGQQAVNILTLPFTSGLIGDNQIFGNGWRSIVDNVNYSAVFGKLGGTDVSGNAIHDNGAICHSTTNCIGIDISASTVVTNIHGNTIYNQTNGKGIRVAGSANLYNNLIYSNADYGIEVQGGTTNIAVAVYRNFIYTNNTRNAAGGIEEDSKGAGTLSLSIQQNTIYQNSGTNGYEVFLADNLTSLTFRNNIVFATATRRVLSSPLQSTPTIDYNLQWRPDGNPNDTYNGAFNLTWVQWKALTFDAHGVNADPKFTNPGTGDFSLQAGSPAIATGLFIAGISVSNPSDIGASPFTSIKAITAFNFNSLAPTVTGTVNEALHTIALTVPYGTDVTTLVPTITMTGTSVNPLSGASQNFTNPVIYTVTATDTSVQNYTITVTVAPNPAKAITTFNFTALSPAVTGVINEGAKTVTLTVPFGTSLTGLVPTVITTGASVSPDSGVANTFVNGVSTNYTVTAADNSTQVYAVTVNVSLNSAKAITAFSFPEGSGTVNESAHTIAVTVPFGTVITALVPTITITGASVNPASNVANDFSTSQVYRVTAADSSQQDYSVTVIVATITTQTNSSSTASAPGCNDPAPGIKPPWLYGAIAQGSGSVLLYFTEADNPVNKYVLEYGTKSGDYPYGVQDMGINSRGQMTYLVKSLSPNTTYYFKVRGGNGCATGTWSNEISAKTLGLYAINNLNFVSSTLTPVTTPAQSEAVPPNSCQIYTVKNGDTLMSIAQNQLGGSTKFQEIIDQNKNTYPAIASHTLNVGWKLNLNCNQLNNQPTTTPNQNGYDVKVKVIDTSKKPVKGATVTIHSNPQTTKTDVNGIALFQNVEAGQHQVLIAYSGYSGQQSINLTGDVKEFDLNVTVQKQNVLLSPQVIFIVGLLSVIIIILIYVLVRMKKKYAGKFKKVTPIVS